MLLVRRHNIVAGFALALTLLGVVLWSDWRYIVGSRELAERAQHEQQVQDQLARLLLRVEDIETTARDFVITGEPAFLEPFEAGLKAAMEHLRALEQSVRGSAQHANLSALAPLVAQRIALSTTHVALRRRSGFEAARQEMLAGKGDVSMDMVRALVSRMDTEQQALQERWVADARRNASIATALSAAGSGLGFIMLVGMFALVLRENRLREQAGQAAASESQRLHDSERLLQESQAVAGLGSYVLDITTGRWNSSPILDGIFGIDDQFERSVEGWTTILHPEWRERMSRYLADEVVGQRRRFDMEHPIIRKSDGQARWVHGVGELEFDAHDRPVRLLGTIMDITERKQAETALRLQSAALHAAADAIVITDRAGVVEWVNPAFTQLTGYTAEEALGKTPGDLVKSGQHAPAFFKDFWETILAGRSWHGEMINRRKDGGLYAEDQSVTPILDASGAITHFVAIKEDKTERVQLEAQFRQAQKMESMGQLASGIAHDFNNLLTVINGTSDLVLDQVGPDDPVRADVLEIHSAGERAATLTRQLLAFSRQQILEPRVLNVNTVVAGLKSLLGRLLGEDIDLAVVPAPGLRNVKADPGQIEQVIINLAVNARDAMPQGGHLTVETQNVEIDEDYARQHGVAVPPGPYVLLIVSDSGVGMDDATRARIFEPFFTTKGPGMGTGLGLSTVFGILKQSHGFIWVHSEVGQGTSFQIGLPQATEAASIDRPGPSVVSSSGTETILLVEDHAGLRKLATRVLETAGYTVLAAATGEEALRLLERHGASVHLVLSDVVMPGMSGRHLAERLARTRPAMKVLYMSGYTGDSIVRHGVLGARVPFLNKPFTAAALLRKVREALDSPASS